MMIVFVVVLNIVNDYMYAFYVRFTNILFLTVKIFHIVKSLVDF